MNNFVMYFVVNSSLNMSVGKIAAQVGHAAHYIIEGYHKKTYDQSILDNYKKWKKNNQRIITLKGKESKLLSLIEKYPNCCAVRDAGYTEVPPNSLTVIAINPIEHGSCSILKRLQCL